MIGDQIDQVKTFISSGYLTELDRICATVDASCDIWLEEKIAVDESIKVKRIETNMTPITREKGDPLLIITHTVHYILTE